MEEESANPISMSPEIPNEFDQRTQTIDEPLNLTICKRQQTYSTEDIVIDLTTGALDLSIKK